MAIHIAADNAALVTVDEFVEHVQAHVDLYDIDSIAAAGQMFRGLANDPELVVRQLNRMVDEQFRKAAIGSTQSIYLGGGRDFYLRANVWPSAADIAGGRIYQDQFSYNSAHDHNYHFMTVGYHGPGYQTDLYEYDRSQVQGHVGERVDLRFVERSHLKTGMVTLYRAGRDVHTQLPPDDLSLTLNFMISTPDVRVRDQYFFDLANSSLANYPGGVDATVRVSILKIAAHVGDENTHQLLHDLAADHPCRRTRLGAYEALATLRPDNAAETWARAHNDSEELVLRVARERLRAALSD